LSSTIHFPPGDAPGTAPGPYSGSERGDGFAGTNGGGGNGVSGGSGGEGFQSIGRSTLRHPVIIAVVTLLGLLAGALVGYKHPVTYTADARLIVGRTSGLAENEVPGLAQAVQGLASDYARLMTTSNVTTTVLTDLHATSLPGTLSASPIAESSIIDVQASSPTVNQALQLANAGAAALTTVVLQSTNDDKAQLNSLLAQYRNADSVFEAAQARASFLNSELGVVVGHLGGAPPSPPVRVEENTLNHQIAQADTQADIARMQAAAYMNQYDAAVPPLQAQEEMIQQVGQAVYSGDNRKSYTEAGALAGAVGGFVIALALVALLDNRRSRHEIAGAET
jgi:capsular polysaccharide biosynthesis protein